MVRLKEVTRTVQYWRLVEAQKKVEVEDQDWNAVLKTAYGGQITHRILTKDVSASVHTMEIRSEWQGFVPPPLDDIAVDYADETIYALVASTDKDHVPNQRNRKTGALKPVIVEEDSVPADNLFIWFLPFGNIMGVMMESVSAARPRAIAAWLTRVMASQGSLPQHNFQWDAVPVIDKNRREALHRAERLKSAFVAGTVRLGASNAFQEVFTGPSFEGNYDIEIRVKPRKDRNPRSYENDTERLLDWFNDTFGELVGQNEDGHGPLTNARVKFKSNPGDDLPTGEVDLLHQRLTRKRNVIMNPGPVQAFVATSAVGEIITAYTLDYEDLLKLR